MKRETKQKDISIRWPFILLYSLLLLITIGSISLLLFSNWDASIKESSVELAEKMNQDVVSRINSFMQVPLRSNDINRKLFENGLIRITDDAAREKFFITVLDSNSENIYSYSFGTADGAYYGALRNKDGNLEVMRGRENTNGDMWYYSANKDMTVGDILRSETNRDPRGTKWYQAAADAKAPAFSEVYRCSIMKDLAISAAQPVYSNGELTGVFNARILLSDMSKRLAAIIKDYNGSVFIVEKDTGYLVANSLGADNYTLSSDGTLERKTYKNLGNHALAQAYQRYETNHQPEQFVPNKKGGLFFHFQEYSLPGFDWMIVSAIPVSHLTTELQRMMVMTAFIGFAALLFSVLVFIFVSDKLFRPALLLLEIAEKFSAGDLSQRAPIIRKNEVGRLSESFNQVADSMQYLVNNLERTVAARTEDLQRANEDLEEKQNKISLILNGTAEGIFGVDMNAICTFCNESSLRLLGYHKTEDMLGKDMRELAFYRYKTGAPRPKGELPLTKYLLEGKAGRAEEEVLWRADGTCFDAEYRALPQLRDGQQTGYIITFTDITERKQEEDQIKYLNSHDAMTGLINRRFFEEQMEKSKNDAENLPISVIIIDLNGLKMINDAFGHSSGDQLIVTAAEVLKENCRDKDLAARIGGDEFAVLLPETSYQEAEEMANHIKSEFSKQKISVIYGSMAAGIATKTKPYQAIEHTIELAENEMYKEKTISRQRFGVEAINNIIHALHEKSAYEKKHSEEVGRLCGEIGAAMKLSKTEIRKLCDAGYLHDIGKIAVSDSVLNENQRKLTEEEQELMRQHPAIGYRILNSSEDLLDLADGVYGHHERWDGSGYPKGLAGEEIPIISRIIAVAEAFGQILRCDEHAGGSTEQALQILLEGAGRHFDPNITEVLSRIYRSEAE